MDITDIISGKSDEDRVSLDGSAVPVRTLRRLLEAGYENILFYPSDGTFSVWGKTCTACLTQEQVEQITSES